MVPAFPFGMDGKKIDRHVIQFLKETGPGNVIKALLDLKKITQKDLSVKLGFTRAELSRVINGLRRTPKIRRAIADALDVPVHILFEPIDHKKND